MNVHEYILKNWDSTIRKPGKHFYSKVEIPFMYTTPCADDTFLDFFYWDTYFTNLGLMRDGYVDQARNNLKVMKYFINKFGFIPNADNILHRSQPPLFTRGVYDLYVFTKDVSVINEFINEILKELDFFEIKRMTPLGLNQYKSDEPIETLREQYDWLSDRLSGLSESEKQIDWKEVGWDLLSIAESGWDFNPRYLNKISRFAAHEFINIDLNALLFDAEIKAAQMLRIINRNNEAISLENKANNRKKLIDNYLINKDGFYLDYNFVEDRHSYFISAASFYPYAVGISDDKETLKKLFDKLDMQFGLSTCEFRGEDAFYFQWDYPAMWPSNVYFAYVALKKCNLIDEAKKLRKQYIDTVDKVFNETGHLWEKYDSQKESVQYNPEYRTPSMMGWTAGVYEFLLNENI